MEKKTAATRTTAPVNRKALAEQTRQSIITAALSCFAQRGFEGTSLQHIAKLSDTTVPLIVYYYKNKTALWQATVDRAVEPFDRQLEQVNNSDLTASDNLKCIINALVQVSTEFPEFHRLMVLESHQPSERLDWLYQRFIKRHQKIMLAAIKAAQAEGMISAIAPERLLHAIIGMATISSQAAEFKKINNKNVFSAAEIKKTIQSIEQLIFLEQR